MSVAVPDFCLVLLLGSSPVAMADFAARHFGPAEIIGPDLDGDALHATVAHRLGRRETTAIDITRATGDDRTALLRIAKRAFARPVVIAVLGDSKKGDTRIRSLRDVVQKLQRDGVRTVHVLREGDEVEIVREPLATDRRDLMGPFDIIGDVHGCADELETLLEKLGYGVIWHDEAGVRGVTIAPPPGRRLIFVGDLVDRGPRTPDVLRIVMSAAAAGHGFCVPGNHDAKFLRWLKGHDVTLTHGLDRSVAQMGKESQAFHQAVKAYLDALPSHIWCDGGRLVVAHAGLTEGMIGRATGAVREFCLYGDTDGATDSNGLAIRFHWAAEYRGETTIVYGHTPVADAIWLNNTLCLDTGCCFGNKLTALRWPERESVSVPALQQYTPPHRTFGHPPLRPPATT